MFPCVVVAVSCPSSEIGACCTLRRRGVRSRPPPPARTADYSKAPPVAGNVLTRFAEPPFFKGEPVVYSDELVGPIVKVCEP